MRRSSAQPGRASRIVPEIARGDRDVAGVRPAPAGAAADGGCARRDQRRRRRDRRHRERGDRRPWERPRDAHRECTADDARDAAPARSRSGPCGRPSTPVSTAPGSPSTLRALQLGELLPAATGTLRTKPDYTAPSVEVQVPALDLARLRAALIAIAGDLDAVQAALAFVPTGTAQGLSCKRGRRRLRRARGARGDPRGNRARGGRTRPSRAGHQDHRRHRALRARRRHAARERARGRDRQVDVHGRGARRRAGARDRVPRARHGARRGPRRGPPDREAADRQARARRARRRRIAAGTGVRPRRLRCAAKTAPGDGRPRADARDRALSRRAAADRGERRRGPVRARPRDRARTERQPRPLDRPGRRDGARARHRARRARGERGRGGGARRVLPLAHVARGAAAPGGPHTDRDRYRGRAARAAVRPARCACGARLRGGDPPATGAARRAGAAGAGDARRR